MKAEYKIISLGYDCFVRRILTVNGLCPSKEEGVLSMPFDLCVTPLSSLIEIMKNDFSDYFENLYFCSDSHYYKNSKYGMFYNHDVDCDTKEKFVERFSSRIKNFKDAIKTEKFIYFVHNLSFSNSYRAEENIENLYKILLKKCSGNKFKLIVLNTFEKIKIKNTDICVISIKNPFEDYADQWWRSQYRNSKEAKDFEKNIIASIHAEIAKKHKVSIYKGIDEDGRLGNQVLINFADFPSSLDSNVFQPYNNLFYNLLSKKYPIVISQKPDFLFCSCFGKTFKNYKNCVKIYFTPETIVPNFNEYDYALAFDDMSFGNRYLRYPLYFLHMKPEHQNRKNLSPELVNRKFCNFIYSNDSAGEGAKLRKEFCCNLTKYKRIDCPGKVLNNMQDAIVPRDGDWAKGKLEFIQNYKFTIAFENNKTLGYTTEKLYNALEANSIPIYWGNPEVVKDFNPKAFINCNDFRDFDEVISKVIELDNDDELYLEMLRQPCMQPYYEFNKEKLLLDFLSNVIDEGNLPFNKNPNPALVNGYCELYSNISYSTKKYFKYKILSKITFGKMRRKYKNKYKDLKKRMENA